MSEKTVLLLDDDPDYEIIVNKMLARVTTDRYDLVAVTNFDAALKAVVDRVWDACLVDYQLGGKTGLDFIKAIRDKGIDTPAILLTGMGDKTTDMAGMQAGADDYLVKGEFDTTLLERALRYAIENKRILVSNKQLERQLAQSQKMESLGYLASGVAHEINNPLAYVKSNLLALNKYADKITTVLELSKQVCENGSDKKTLLLLKDAYQQGKIDYILGDMNNLFTESVGGLKRVEEIVAGLKTFAREDDQVLQPVNVNQCIESAIKMTMSELVRQNILVNKDLGDLPEIQGNSGQLIQVVTNLLINSAQAMGEKGEINIKTWQEDDHVHFSVQDDGKGIAHEHLAHIFDPFFTTKPVGQGTGLGLAISYGIIQDHNGAIAVESDLIKGTTFTIKLPLST